VFVDENMFDEFAPMLKLFPGRTGSSAACGVVNVFHRDADVVIVTHRNVFNVGVA
jgi:hypothetical protein